MTQRTLDDYRTPWDRWVDRYRAWQPAPTREIPEGDRWYRNGGEHSGTGYEPEDITAALLARRDGFARADQHRADREASEDTQLLAEDLAAQMDREQSNRGEKSTRTMNSNETGDNGENSANRADKRVATDGGEELPSPDRYPNDVRARKWDLGLMEWSPTKIADREARARWEHEHEDVTVWAGARDDGDFEVCHNIGDPGEALNNIERCVDADTALRVAEELMQDFEAEPRITIPDDWTPEAVDPNDPPAGDPVLIMYHVVGLNRHPKTITGEVSGSGKSVMVEHDGRTRRLDASEIFAGGSEYRDSTCYELYTPGRLRRRQSISNAAKHPHPGHGKSDPEDLPDPTHWPNYDDPEDAPDECPNCGDTDAPWKDEGRLRCEMCGELVPEDGEDEQDESEDNSPGKWDIGRLERADVLILDGFREEFLVVNIKKARSSPPTPVAADIVGDDGTELRLRSHPTRDAWTVRQNHEARAVMHADGPAVEDYERVRSDKQWFREWVGNQWNG